MADLTQSSQVVKTEAPAWYTDTMSGLASSGANAANALVDPTTGLPTAAATAAWSPNTLQTQAFGNVSTNVGNYLPGLNTAATTFGKAGATDISGASNPYLKAGTTTSGLTAANPYLTSGTSSAADLVGGINVKAKDAEVMHALLDMSTTAQIKDSLKLGGEILGQIGRVGKLHKGSVEQAGFAVLKAPDIPSILVETAFISNPEEEAKLRDERYQAQLVEALTVGIRRYFARNPALARARGT